MRRGRKLRAPATKLVPSEAPSVMVMVPQMGKKSGKSGCWGGTKGAAPGPRRGRGAGCPRATRGAFYAPVVGGNAPESALVDRSAIWGRQDNLSGADRCLRLDFILMSTRRVLRKPESRLESGKKIKITGIRGQPKGNQHI